MLATVIGSLLQDDARALVGEVETLEEEFCRMVFYGDNRNFPMAHFGYLMTAMSKVDLMSAHREFPCTPMPRTECVPLQPGATA